MQRLAGPEIEPEIVGSGATSTKEVLGADAPHRLFAVTPIVPDEPAVTVIVLLLLLPLHPAGNVHV
jgi:hypothetical protein